ncbi:conserved hypothetical protein [Clostridium neonatale]|jgi:phage shock protein A|uniref:conjugal transfer protein TraD n=1 Tax=Clostridium neonatale TaxID=137838 RepID=UPI001D713A52|nr:conjugal transfer protein TraD [Clostridium neonatale]CAG9713938.1 conserved hypothetical protein [Clostridium neonatale]CAI3580888.1 conserved hypothetical protein [Clostridium neonatale]
MAVDSKEKISKLDEKIKQLQAQKSSLLAKEKEKERKARTRRLIQIGAIFDSIGIDTLDKANSFKNEFDNDEKCKNWINKIISSNEIKKKSDV